MNGRNRAEVAPLGPGKEPLERLGDHPPPEDQFGGGDICSPEETAPADDDKPVD
jgi:hypothetical protein